MYSLVCGLENTCTYASGRQVPGPVDPLFWTANFPVSCCQGPDTQARARSKLIFVVLQLQLLLLLLLAGSVYLVVG